MASFGFVKVSGIKKVKKKTKVFNFHVPKYENYFASNILTHNCYVPRHKGNSNPLTVFLNTEAVIDATVKHCNALGNKTTPNQCDSSYWTYDLGNNNDVSLDLHISNNALLFMEAIRDRTRFGKTSFATKTVNLEPLVNYEPKNRARIRYSLMPQAVSRYVDIRTSPISDRIAAINVLVDAGYEVHVNFSPVILYGEDQWKKDWVRLWQEMNDVLTDKAKAQLKAEIIFLTHSEAVHNLNMQWNPKGESFLWRPDIQQPKLNKPDVLCYSYNIKSSLVKAFQEKMKQYLPYCKVRYAF
jgi:DNA repair photolyase